MRRTPPTIHFLAATDTAFSTATMSSRPYHRGRRSGFFGPGRSYSGGRDQFVTGDDHLQSVRNANSELRRGESGNFANQNQYNQHPSYNPRPYPSPSPHCQNPQFRQPPPPQQYQNPSFRHPPPPQFQNPPFRYPPPPQFQNPQFRHRPPHFRPSPPFDQGRPFRQPQNTRPKDYREWELALTPPPPHSERFKVLSYNILADYLAVDHRRKLYFHVPPYVMDWQRRKSSIIFELGLWSADIMCFQEVDRFHELAEDLKLKGYSGFWKMRTGNPVDGCAIFWRTSRFKLLYEECIEFNKLGLRDNVAQICVLEFINQNGSLSPSSTGSRKVVVCNIHVLYNPNRGEIKLGQVRTLLDKAQAVSKLWNNAPVIICGDFNCTPKSPLYNFIAEQKLDLSGVDRDKVSGQASAAIPPPKLYGPNSSEKSSAIGSAPATSTVGDREVNIEQNSSLSDMQNSEKKSNSSENYYTHTELNMSDKTNVDGRRESDAYAGNYTQEAAAHNKVFVEVDSVKEEPSPSYSKALDTVHTDPTGIGSTEHISDATISTSNQESLSEKTNLLDHNGNKHMESNCFPTPLQEDDQASKVKIDLESADLLNEDISLNTQSSQTLVSGSLEISHQGYGESSYHEVIANDQINCSATAYQVDKSQQLTNIDVPLDGKLENLSLDEVDKTDVGCENIGEADTDFINSLHNAKGVDPDLGPSVKSDLEQSYQFEELDSTSNNLLPKESIDVEGDFSPSPISKSTESYRTTYNPSLWTPAEIETAAGNAERTFLEHPLPLRSTYTEATGCSGTRDPHGEPQVTSYNRCFLGTVDYIWRSAGLQTTRVLAPIPKHAMEWTPGYPTKKWGSDHIALVSELAFLKDDNDINKDV